MRTKWKLIGAVWLACAAPAAFGSPIYSWSGSATGYAESRAAGSTTSCSYSSVGSQTSCNFENNGNIPLTYNTFSAQGYQPYPDFAGDPTDFIANVSSSADSAGLHAYAFAELDGNIYVPGFSGGPYDDASPGSGSATSTAEQQDTWTPVAPANWNRQPFYMTFTFQVDGETSSYLSPGATGQETAAYAELEFQVGHYVGSQYNQYFTLPEADFPNGVTSDTPFNDSITTAPMEIGSLAAFNYYFTLTTYASVSCSTSPAEGTCSATATSQLSNTATLTGISFQDANGNPIPGFTLESSSGTNYDNLITSNQTAAPEPGTLWMLAAGAGLWAAGRVRRGKR